MKKTIGDLSVNEFAQLLVGLGGVSIDKLLALTEEEASPTQSAKKESDRFEQIGEMIQITISKDYKPDNQLALFKKQNQGDFLEFNPNITDENYVRIKESPVPGRTYYVKLFTPKIPVWYRECLSFSEGKNVRFFGVQGLTLVWSEIKKKFEKSIDAKWLFPLVSDIKELWKDSKDAGDKYVIPAIDNFGSKHYFKTMDVRPQFCQDSCFLVFYEQNPDAVQ